MNEYSGEDFIISQMRWSFSRVNSFDTCPYAWHKDYVECAERDSSAMAQFGSLMHEILEKYAKGELSIFEISQFYMDNFDKYVTEEFPPNKYVDLRQKYYDAGLDYLDNINLDLDDYEVLGVEHEVQFTIANHEFIGFIDLLLKNKTTGEIIILDHKSASISILKNGQVSKKDREHFEQFKRQLYLYAIPILEKYGRVDKLVWNLFKEQRFIEIPFNQDEYHAAITWAEDTVSRIEGETEWGLNPEFIKAREEHKFPPFFCTQLCSQRSTCPHKKEYLSQLLYEKQNDYNWWE